MSQTQQLSPSIPQLLANLGTLQEELDEMGVGRAEKARRGTSNGNATGNAEDRRRRRLWLLSTYAADVVLVLTEGSTQRREVPRSTIDLYEAHEVIEVCRCYRCGKLLTLETLTVDRIKPGAQGGTYRRENIRPACGPCNEVTGGAVRRKTVHACLDCRREDPNGERRYPRKLQQWGQIERCATHLKQLRRARGKRS